MSVRFDALPVGAHFRRALSEDRTWVKDDASRAHWAWRRPVGFAPSTPCVPLRRFRIVRGDSRTEVWAADEENARYIAAGYGFRKPDSIEEIEA